MKNTSLIAGILLLWMAMVTGAFAQAPASGQESASGFITASIKVKGITCAMDLKSIAANVEKIEGVIACKPGKQGTTTTFEVQYAPARTSEKEIYAAIENTAGCENPGDRPYKVKL